MKKATLTLLIFLTLLISACSSTPRVAEAGAQIVESSVQKPPDPAPAEAAQKPVQTEFGELNTAYKNAVPVTMQLLLGTIKLEGTELAVTAEQATALTPLWTNFKSVSESIRPTQGDPGQGQGQLNATPQPVDSGLQTQLEEIIKQIQSVMTTEQIKAIAAMQITQEISQTIMEEQGITMGGPQQGNGNMPGGGGGQPPAGGDMPQGTPPVGGPGGGQQPGADQMGTPPAGGMQPGGMGFIPSELIDALVQLLGQKTSS